MKINREGTITIQPDGRVLVTDYHAICEEGDTLPIATLLEWHIMDRVMQTYVKLAGHDEPVTAEDVTRG